MYKNKTGAGRNNLSGENIRRLRLRLPGSPSQHKFAQLLQLKGLDLDKNAIQRIEAGKRFVTDIELKTIADTLNVTTDELLMN